MVNIKISELEKLPYIAGIPAENQTFYGFPYFDEDREQYSIQYFNDNGGIISLYAVPVESFYYSKSKTEIEEDLFTEFFNILICDYSYTFADTLIDEILNDISNLSAIFEKYFIFSNHFSTGSDRYKPVLVRTEIEYFFGVIRSLYDLLQNLIKLFVKNYMKIELPNSYAHMFDNNKKIKSNWPKLPKRFIAYYNSTAKLFFTCRDIRDKIYHYGTTNQFIVHFEEGFGIDQELLSFSEFNIWPQDKVKKNNIVSLLALFAYVTKDIIQNMNELALVLLEEFKPQNRFISIDYMIFFRGPCTEHLNKLDKYLDEQWFK